jgi:hypothetical protein
VMMPSAFHATAPSRRALSPALAGRLFGDN